VSAAEGRDLVFVGGTGRSGTHALARLIGCHRHFADVPIEARFHCNKRGMPDLLEGRITLRAYLEKLRGFWWHRVRVDGQPRGLYNLLTRRDFDAALGAFEAGYGDDPIRSCRTLFWALLGPTAERQGKPGLVEMSSHNVREAQALGRIFPEARIIHALRDGRDSAASVSGKTWGPGSVLSGIDWWAERLRAIDAGVRGEEDGAPYAIAAERFHVVLLDELVAGGREQAYADLWSFLGVEQDEQARAHFDQQMTAEAAHLGRWRSQLSRATQALVMRRYERTISALEREGNHAAPPLRAALGGTAAP